MAADTRTLVFRWGEMADDRDLTDHAHKTDEKYELTNGNILSVVNFSAQKGWNRSSGDGVYFSNHPNAWFGDGRYELFIFELVSPQGVPFPIAQGSLGSSVREFYLNQKGPPPPMISQYSPTAYVIARVPNKSEEQAGFHINFWPATSKDAKDVWKQLKAQLLKSDQDVDQLLSKFNSRLGEAEYASKLPANTLQFIQALAEEAQKTETSPTALATIQSITSQVRSIQTTAGCAKVISKLPKN